MQSPDSSTTLMHKPGLSTAAARLKLEQSGPNAIADKVVPVWQQLLVKFWAPVPWMLEAVIVLQLLLGRRTEALVIAALLAFNAVVAFAQEQRAKDALRAFAQAVACQCARAAGWKMEQNSCRRSRAR